MGLIDVSVHASGDDGIEKLLNNAKKLDGLSIDAGIFGGFAAQKAMWQEYGTIHIPARPFLRNTLYEKGSSFASQATPFLYQIIEGGSTAGLVSGLGSYMSDAIKATIDAGNFAPLAPATVARKGHSKPLIDTGDMYGAITYRQGGGSK